MQRNHSAYGQRLYGCDSVMCLQPYSSKYKKIEAVFQFHFFIFFFLYNETNKCLKEKKYKK